MSDDSSRARDAAFQTCRNIARAAVERYSWTLLTPDELAEHIVHNGQPEATPADIERQVITHYTLMLYNSCRQTESSELRERAYGELYRFLYRAAHNRWSDHVEEVAQHALELVYEQIANCAKPAAFLAFALFKLLQAHTDVLRGVHAH